MKYSIILFTICLVLAVVTETNAIALVSKKLSLGNVDWISSRAVMETRPGFVKRGKKDDNKNNDKNVKKLGDPVNAQITFYEGQSLKNSACYGNSGVRNYDANENDMIAAMNMKDLELCYECLEIRNPTNNNKIIVKVIDKCDGCPPGGDNIDLTPTAFKQLADLNSGRVEIEWRPLDKCPNEGRWPIFEELDKSH